MKKQIRKILLTFFFLLGALLGITQHDGQPLPKLSGRVMDLTSTLSSSQKKELEGQIMAFEREKGSQVVVLIIPTSKPEAIEQYGVRLAEKWKIGRKGIDDGVILIIAKNDRKLRIEVGYGLEGAIPDIYAKRIISNVIIPQFRQGNFYAGIYNGVRGIIGLINKEDLPEVTSVSKSNSKNVGWSFLIIIIIIIGFVLKATIKSSKIKGVLVAISTFILFFITGSFIIGIIAFASISLFFFMPAGTGSRRGGYYGGGGFGSGGSFGGGGGFSGGGGGFGGGGASGGW